VAEWTVPGLTELRTLGSGGFGTVVAARDEASGTLVAVKYLRADLLADVEFAAMFRGEAEVLASVRDPNVVRLYEYVEGAGGAAIVMELVDGVSLREILSNQGKTAPEAALVVLQGSLLGLAAAHAIGVVHRDYKPENVLVNGDGVSKLTDFGIAARAGDSALPAGTLMYAPPEQFAGAPASPASDVYAATATFYECLTGGPPFAGRTAEVLMYQHMAEPVKLEPVPEELRPLIETGMAKNPARRPTDGTSFVAALQAAAAGAYGPDWEQRGRSYLGEAALLLAALWPSGGPPGVGAMMVEKVPLYRRMTASKAAVIGSAAVFIAAAGTALAATSFRESSTAPTHPAVAAVQQVTLSATPSASPAPSLSPTPSPTPSPTKSQAAAPTLPPPATFSPLPSPKPSPSSKPSPTPSATPSPTPPPPPSASPSPTPLPTLTYPKPSPTPTRPR
jgi:eukaryotic-like serine/threonine-protein kinase